MSVVAVLKRGRGKAESLMRDTIRITRLTGAVTTDPNPPYVVTEERVTVYEGPGKIQSNVEYEQSVDLGDSIRATTRMLLHIPVDACQAEVGDQVTVVVAALDERLTRRTWRITQIAPYKSLATADRMYIEAQ